MNAKYICTMGPSMKENMLIKMYNKGMSMIRINMSHVDYNIEELLYKINNLRSLGYDIKVLIDTKGPEIRLKIPCSRQIEENEQIILGQDIDLNCDYQDLEPNDILELNDG